MSLDGGLRTVLDVGMVMKAVENGIDEKQIRELLGGTECCAEGAECRVGIHCGTSG